MKLVTDVDLYEAVDESARNMSVGLLAPLTLAAIALMSTLTGSGAGRGSIPPVPSAVRIVDVRGAAALVARGAAVLDARGPVAYQRGHLPSAQPYDWSKFTGEGAQRGRIRPDLAALAQVLSALGIDTGRPALVYGAAGGGWGEEGHAAWLLALLGHTDVAVLDGGFDAWRAAGRPVVTSSTPPRAGAFVPRPQTSWQARREDIGKAEQVLDVRSAVEFAGATPFGEARGGHIPRALHLDWRALLDESGRVRPAARLVLSLREAGVDPDREIVTVCTAGVRSAFAAAVLSARGVARVRNYDGSMLEWSSDPAAPLART